MPKQSQPSSSGALSKGFKLSTITAILVLSVTVVSAGIMREDWRPRLQSRAANSVDTASGAFVQEINLISMQGVRGLDLNLTYRSDLAHHRGALGFGWTHQYEAAIPAVSPNENYSNITVKLDALRWSTYVPDDPSFYQAQGVDFHDNLFRGPAPDRAWRLVRPSGVQYDFDGVGRLLKLVDRKGLALYADRYVTGFFQESLYSISEPLAGRRVLFAYRKSKVAPSIPLLSYLTYGAGNAYMRVLKYDDFDRLIRIYDPVQMAIAAERSDSVAVNPGASGVDYPVTVSRIDSNRLIRAFGSISGFAPETLEVELISPSGKRVTLDYENTHPTHASTFPINAILDDYFDESMAGTWKLHVTDDTSDGINHTINNLILYAADDPANWTEYDYETSPSRRLTRAVDSEGKLIFANLYDSNGRVTTQVDGRSKSWRFAYETSAEGDLKTRVFSRSPNTEITTFVHDADFNLLSVEDALENKTEFAYRKGTGDRTSITDANGNRTYFSYDSQGRLTSVTEPNLAQTFFEHDGTNLTGVTDALKFESQYEYDEFGRMITITNPLGITQDRLYSDEGELNYTINKNGNGIEYQYTEGMPTSAFVITDEDNVDRFEYDSLGRLIKTISPDGKVANIVYDNRGNIIEKSNGEGEKITSTFDHRNRLATERDARGNLTTYAYDGNGNLTSIRNSLDEVTRFTYDPEDRLVTIRNPAGHITSRSSYDVLGRVVQETVGGQSLNYQYDELGNRIRVLSSSGTVETEYNLSSLPVRVTDVRGNVTSFKYDLLGQQIERTEPGFVEVDNEGSNTTSFKFDAMNRIERVTDRLGREYKKTFEPDDVVKDLSNAAGKKTSFSYTDRNQLAGVTTPLGLTTRFEYTGEGYIKRFIPPKAARAQEYVYDAAGRLVRTKHADTSMPDFINDYDPNGNRVRVSTQASGGGVAVVKISQTYDALNRVTSTRDAENQTVGYAYNESGRVSRITYPDGKKVDYTYDLDGRIVTVKDWAGRVTEYSWWNGNQIAGIRFPNGTARVMEYSSEDLLLKRTDFGSNGEVIVGYEYSYDINGFITAEQTRGETPTAYSPFETSYTYDDDNRLTNIGGASVGYDDDGNVINGPVGGLSTAMQWDVRNNLSQVGDSVYRYDEEDRLVGWVNGSETVKLTVVDAREGSRVMVSTRSSGPVTRYVYGVGLAYEEIDGQIRVLHYDERGNTTALSDGSGNVVGRLNYAPFGKVIQKTGDADTIFKFGGLFGVVSSPDGLNFMRFRWYSPEMQRFISMDSQLGDIVLPISLNRFIFAGNNPINFNDPEGEWLNIVVGAVGGAILGATVELVSSGIQGKPVNWDHVAAAAIGGAVAGGISAAGGVGFSALGGGLGSISEDLSSALISGTDVNAGSLILGGVTGAVAGGIGGSIGKYLKGQWAKSVALDAKISKNFSKPLERLTKSAFSRATKNEAIKDALKFTPRLAGDFIEDALAGSLGNEPDPSPEVSVPPGRVGAIIEGVTRMPTASIGKGGEFLHYQRYLDALSAADRPLPNPPESLATF